MEQTIKDYLAEKYGIRVHHIDLKSRKDSHFGVPDGTSYRNVPFLSLCVYESSYEKICKNRAMGLADDEIAQQVRSLIKNSDMEQSKKEECYDKEMYIGVLSWDEFCYRDFVYNHKAQIQECIYEILSVNPSNIYASSLPGINIVYTTEDYRKYSIATYEEKIRERIIKLADDFVQKKYCEKLDNGRFSVKVWNPDMQGYSAYGLARQD